MFSKKITHFHPPAPAKSENLLATRENVPSSVTLGGRHITLHFSQHSRGLNIVQFLANNLKTNLKKTSHLETLLRQIHCYIKHCNLISSYSCGNHAWLFFEFFSVFSQKFGNESKIRKKFSITL